MGHLGEGTKITTVSTQKVVLTADNGQNFTMEMSDLAEAVRQVMPVATSEQKGLMSSTNAMRFLSLLPDDEVEIDGTVYCLLLIKNNSSGRTSLFLVGHRVIDIIYSSGDISTDVNSKKLVVYKKGEGKSCYIRNNENVELTFRVVVL